MSSHGHEQDPSLTCPTLRLRDQRVERQLQAPGVLRHKAIIASTTTMVKRPDRASGDPGRSRCTLGALPERRCAGPQSRMPASDSARGAEGEGFEPSIRLTTDNGFRDRHVSARATAPTGSRGATTSCIHGGAAVLCGALRAGFGWPTRGGGNRIRQGVRSALVALDQRDAVADPSPGFVACQYGGRFELVSRCEHEGIGEAQAA